MIFRVSKKQLSLFRLGLLFVAAWAFPPKAVKLCADTGRSTPIVQAIQRAEPAVVNIQGNKTITNANASGKSTKQEVNGMGTGVIIDRRGYIITNYHVVDEVGKIEVTLADGTSSIARLINYDPETDLALIKIETRRELPVIQVGRSDDLMRGETVIAIGNPFGYQNTVTVGIISALHRDIPVNGTQQYNDLIQTNADINPGNSGGPLLNIEGEVIGINVAVRVGAQGIGFAIPIDTALEVMAELVAAHRDAGSHGLTFSKVSDSTGSQLIIREAKGAQINSSRDIRNGDQVATVEGQRVSNRLELELALLEKRNGDAVEFGLERNGTRLAQSIILASTKTPKEVDPVRATWELLGLRLSPVPASALAGVSDTYKGGLKINDVRPGSPAERARLAAGDIIIGVMDWQTPKIEYLTWILNNPTFQSAPSAKYYLVRKRLPLTVSMSLEPSALSAINRNSIKDVR
ncbi:MAG: trypsin-like peptidase domain-containing protein [Pirellula sp.]